VEISYKDGNEPTDSIERQQISWLVDRLLAFQECFYSTESEVSAVSEI